MRLFLTGYSANSVLENKMSTDNENNVLLLAGAEKLGLAIDSEAMTLLESYCDDVCFWNKVAGISSHKTRRDIIINMFLDSLAGIKVLDRFEYYKVLDIGTGGGFPGLPIRILKKRMNLTLMDSSEKKAQFLRNLIKKFCLENVNVCCMRAEMPQKFLSCESDFDIVLSRAMAPLNELISMSLNFLKPQGRIIAWKGPGVSVEIKESDEIFRLSHAEIEDIYYYELPFSDRKRNITIVRKT